MAAHAIIGSSVPTIKRKRCDRSFIEVGDQRVSPVRRDWWGHPLSFPAHSSTPPSRSRDGWWRSRHPRRDRRSMIRVPSGRARPTGWGEKHYAHEPLFSAPRAASHLQPAEVARNQIGDQRPCYSDRAAHWLLGQTRTSDSMASGLSTPGEVVRERRHHRRPGDQRRQRRRGPVLRDDRALTQG